jgi:hypothetical protein
MVTTKPEKKKRKHLRRIKQDSCQANVWEAELKERLG